MIGYGKLGLLIECHEKIAVSACAVRIVGVECVRPSAVRCRLMVVVLSRLQSLHFVLNFLIITHRFQKNNASYSGILLAQVTCPEAIEISREVFIIDMDGEET